MTTHQEVSGVEGWDFDPAMSPREHRRELILSLALADGRLAPASLPQWRERWDRDPDSAEQLLDCLAPALAY